jgi:hypothetical protein
MLVDHAGALRWASASDQVAAPVSAGQERLAQGLAAHEELVGQDRPNVHRLLPLPDRTH